MSILAKGASGAEVIRLQKRLKARGFDPGHIDGRFGAGTDAAVRAFQKSKGLVVDGIAGPKTYRALRLAVPESKFPRFEPDSVTVAVAAEMFPGAPLGNIKASLPSVLRELDRASLADRPMTLMALATIRAESAGFEPICEYRSRYNTSPNGHPFDLYDNREDLGNRGAPDGARFKGRGFVQLTGRDNYRRIGRKIGLGTRLEREPELANDPAVAARILAAFLKVNEVPIKQALVDDDLRAARKLVNGGSHGLAQFAECYRTGERLLA